MSSQILMNIVHNPQIMNSPTILVSLDSYLFLQDKSYFERCGKHHIEDKILRLVKNFDQFRKRSGNPR